MPVLWFRASTCFQFWSKTFTKCCTNNSLLSQDKTISFLNWLVKCFQFQKMFWKNINCFWFWWKTYTRHCKSNDVMQCVKRLSSPALCGWSGGLNFSVWFGKWNMAVKILILILFYFCLLCWLKSHHFASCLFCSCKLF